MATVQQALELYSSSLRDSDVLAHASRYELERCAHALWQEILLDEWARDEVVIAHRSLLTALRLRKMQTQ